LSRRAEPAAGPPRLKRWRVAALISGTALVLAGLVAAAALVVMTDVGCVCAATPTRPPGWTPWPTSLDAAVSRVSGMAGASVERSWSGEVTLFGRPFYWVEGMAAAGYVDANTGGVVEMVRKDLLPDDATVAVSVDSARNSAERLVTAAGATTGELEETATVERVATVAFIHVAWTRPGAAGPSLSVFVNAASGDVFAYRDDSAGIMLEVPVIGHQAAMRLASRSSWLSGATPDPAFQPLPEFSALDSNAAAADGHEWSWFVSVPLPDTNYINVDAATGEVYIYRPEKPTPDSPTS
jgi:hypothetical protein